MGLEIEHEEGRWLLNTQVLGDLLKFSAFTSKASFTNKRVSQYVTR